MKAVALIKRKLKPGKTYDDFRKVWYHTNGFGVDTKMYTVINAFDPSEIIVIGILNIQSEQELNDVLKIDVNERLENSLDDIIEPEIDRDFGALVAIDDFSAKGVLEYKLAEIDGKPTDFDELYKSLSFTKNSIIEASKQRDEIKQNKHHAGFMGSFKLGDNINYNLKILSLLYENNTESNNHLLNKPIILIIISVIEALLADLLFKAKNYTQEGVPGISDEILEEIRNNKYERFELYISAAKKYNLLEQNNNELYDELETLRELRNRVHIQNNKNKLEPDDQNAFSVDRKIQAEKVCEKIIRIMSNSHDRGHNFVYSFTLPWENHYS